MMNTQRRILKRDDSSRTARPGNILLLSAGVMVYGDGVCCVHH